MINSYWDMTWHLTIDNWQLRVYNWAIISKMSITDEVFAEKTIPRMRFHQGLTLWTWHIWHVHNAETLLKLFLGIWDRQLWTFFEIIAPVYFDAEKRSAKVLWSSDKMWLPLLSQTTSSASSSRKSKDSAAIGTKFLFQENGITPKTLHQIE